jgi:hypothetical protein
MLKPTLVTVLDVGLYTACVLSLGSSKLLVTLCMLLFIRRKVLNQSK